MCGACLSRVLGALLLCTLTAGNLETKEDLDKRSRNKMPWLFWGVMLTAQSLAGSHGNPASPVMRYRAHVRSSTEEEEEGGREKWGGGRRRDQAGAQADMGTGYKGYK